MFMWYHVDTLTLSTEQQFALDSAIKITRDGGQFFLTGRPGTGKTATTRETQRHIDNVVVFASTGLGAVLAGGQTVHSGCGFKPGPITPECIDPDEKRLRVLRNADLIQIDEVSMVRSDVLQGFHLACQMAMESSAPFGGKAVVFVGDVWQIEPVVSDQAERHFLNTQFGGPFFFDAPCWKEAGVPMLELTQIFRQAGDTVFMNALHNIRNGPDPTALRTFDKCVRQPDEDSVRLTFTNRKAKAINDTALLAIDASSVFYESKMSGFFGKDLPVEPIIEVKEGARVMTMANNRQVGYVNGDTGIVTQLLPDVAHVLLDRTGATVPVERFVWEKREHVWNEEEEKIEMKVVASYTQIPLKLAYASTVHKAQGQTYDKCHMELEMNSFAHGQTFVGLSRCRTMDGLTLARKLSHKDIVVNPQVRNWWNWMTSGKNG